MLNFVRSYNPRPRSSNFRFPRQLSHGLALNFLFMPFPPVLCSFFERRKRGKKERNRERETERDFSRSFLRNFKIRAKIYWIGQLVGPSSNLSLCRSEVWRSPPPPLLQSRSRELSHWLNPYVRIMKLLLSGSLLREKSKVLSECSLPVRWIFLFFFFFFFTANELAAIREGKGTFLLWLNFVTCDFAPSLTVPLRFHFFPHFRFSRLLLPAKLYNGNKSLIFTDLHFPRKRFRR